MSKIQNNRVTPHVDANYYFGWSYDNVRRFCSYWYQLNEIVKLKPGKVLEIGIGNGLVSNYLKERNVNITTLDIDERLKPDVVGSVLDLPFADNSFDVVACFEVLEHLPYEKFHTALLEIYRVSKSYAILSLPDMRRVLALSLYISRVGEIKKLIPLPRFGKRDDKFDRHHYWEIGHKEYPLKRVIADITKVKFKVLKTYRAFEQPYHRFFILKK